MYISRVVIRNYRNISHLDVKLLIELGSGHGERLTIKDLC